MVLTQGGKAVVVDIPIMLVDADAPMVPSRAGNRENIIAEQLTTVPRTPATAPACSFFTMW